MTTAYVLIQFGVADGEAALAEIRKIAGVKQAHALLGPVDIIAVVEVADQKSLIDTVMKIRKVKGVASNDTRLAWPF